MSRYATVVVAIVATMLSMFAAVEVLGPAPLVDPAPFLSGGLLAAGVAATAWLISDVLLPIPSSLILLSNGATFGPAAGAIVSSIGVTGSASFAFWIGRRGLPTLMGRVRPSDLAAARTFFTRWGRWAVVLSRPLPILAETVALLAGSAPMRFGPFLLASLLGNVPMCIAYAIVGGRLSMP